MRISGFVDAHTYTLYLDTSGDALFKRGWRDETGEAPLRENLAAGLLRTSGWKPGMVLFDPMCGSGTILAEAAQMLAGIPAGARRRFAFENSTTSMPPHGRQSRATSNRIRCQPSRPFSAATFPAT